MQQLTDPYRALGVPRGATEAEIKAAHRKLVKRYHPDAGAPSETDRFLRVQEAYRVLSDPLLRKEWDQKHAPGPIRADQSPASNPPRRRRPPPRPEAEPAESAAPPRQAQSKRTADPRTQPRSARSYTWSASEVPWWEEARTDKSQSNSKSGAKSSRKQQPKADKADKASAQSAASNADSPGVSADEGPVFTQQDFDVYNRSSGAAWSMAARAYFRKGEADLPRRGSFRLQGTQVVTAGRARAAAEAEARHRAAAAAAAMEDVFATPQAVPHAPGPREGTTHIVRRAVASPWPSLAQRFILALVAWLPIAAVVAAAMPATGDELVGLALTAVALLVLVALPRVAYIATVATVLVLIVGGLFVGGLVLAGRLPPLSGLTTFIGGLLVVGYLVTAAVITVGPPSLRPWSAP